MPEFLSNWEQWAESLIVLLLAGIAALVGHYVLMKVVSVLARRSDSVLDNLLLKYLREPLRWVLVVLVVGLVSESLDLPADVERFGRHLFSILTIALVGWLLTRGAGVLSDIVLLRFELGSKDNLQARKVHTQVNVLRRIAIAVILLITVAAILMTFPRVRQLGTAILASAGIAGIVLGFAAQRTLGNLIAGLQIAFTQPMRIDDVVIVEGEWGRIEEITLTYVVVKIWDLRRLVVPITYFIEKPFQNWTRVTSDILGTVYLYADYTIPIDAVRTELGRILEQAEHWDGKVNVLQVTNTSERTVELRALMSAADASTAWTLRCHVREKLVEFVQREYPQALPRVRAELEQTAAEPPAPPEPGPFK